MERKIIYMDENYQETTPEKAKYKWERWEEDGELIMEAVSEVRR